MRVKKKAICLLATLGIAMLLMGCVKKDDIKLLSIDKVDMISDSKLEVTISMENKSRSSVSIMDGRMFLEYDGEEILQLLVSEDMVIPKRFNGEIVVPLRVKITDLLGIFALAANMQNEQVIDELSIRATAKVKVGGIKRDVVIERIPVRSIADKMNLGEEIKKLMKEL